MRGRRIVIVKTSEISEVLFCCVQDLKLLLIKTHIKAALVICSRFKVVQILYIRYNIKDKL